MATTYRWYINELQTYPIYEGYSDFVTNVRWRYNATNDQGYSSDIFGQTTFNVVNDTPEHAYVPYSALTETECNNWLDTHNDVVTLQAQLDANINEKMNPIISTLPIPWES